MKRKRARFNMSHVNSTTCKMGFVVPVMLQEALPGDTWQGDTKLFTRVAPLVAPVMHRVQQQVYTFFVSNRLLWKNWEQFITGGPDGLDTSIPPTVDVAPTVGSLSDYFGLPLSDNKLTVSALPFRALALIWNDYFRDQDLQEPVEISLDDGPDTTTPTDMYKANWAKDYFTTARPWPQKGPSMSIPLVGDGSIVADGPLLFSPNSKSNNGVAAGSSTYFQLPLGDNRLASALGYYGLGQGNSEAQATERAVAARDENASASTNLEWLNPNSVFSFERASGAYANVATQALQYASGLAIGSPSQAGLGIDVNDFRETMAVQRWQEKRSLFGSRYEDLLHFWGLNTQDYRLQRPELISIRNSLLQFSEVLQTSPVDGVGVGNMSGHGIGAMRSGRWRYYCHEHGFLITVLVVRPQAVYTQGIERMWSRSTRFDFWNPEFQHIGQQEILRKEIFADGSEDDDEIWGYQNRFDEYRRGKNHVSGEFRTTLDFWNMARKFENAPALNGEFLTSSPTDRIFQLSESLSDQLYIMVQNDLLAKRLMSRQGNPK